MENMNNTLFREEVRFWAPRLGVSEILIVPFIAKNELIDYRVLLDVHYNVGPDRNSYVCPRTVYKACPLCEERERLVKNGEYDGDEITIRSLRPIKRAAYNVIFENDFEVKVWVAPYACIELEMEKFFLSGYRLKRGDLIALCIDRIGGTRYDVIDVEIVKRADIFSANMAVPYALDQLVTSDRDQLKQQFFGLAYGGGVVDYASAVTRLAALAIKSQREGKPIITAKQRRGRGLRKPRPPFSISWPNNLTLQSMRDFNQVKPKKKPVKPKKKPGKDERAIDFD